ncbi:MAG TPA: hypothetical protein VFQ57_02180 [Sphingomonas sp.]|jgi:hypothetical protein|nr:hypothetical protein [Sphingomonas sp.]
MMQRDPTLFEFQEPDHLTRIHLKMELEDLGFVVDESVEALAIVGGRPKPDVQGLVPFGPPPRKR